MKMDVRPRKFNLKLIAVLVLATGVCLTLLYGTMRVTHDAHANHGKPASEDAHAKHGSSHGSGHAAVIAPMQKQSENGMFEVSVDPQSSEKIELNEFVEWVVTIQTPEGDPVTPARVSVGGGMPAHGHGFPTDPQISEHSEEGKYLLKGLMFSMTGTWLLELDIQSKEASDKVAFDIDLDF